MRFKGVAQNPARFLIAAQKPGALAAESKTGKTDKPVLAAARVEVAAPVQAETRRPAWVPQSGAGASPAIRERVEPVFDTTAPDR